jgi:hypothetical protein
MRTLRILLQTTIRPAPDDWNVGRFSLLAGELSRLATDGLRCEVVARNRDAGGEDSVLASIDRSNVDQVWLIGVDTGNGLTKTEADALTRFRRRGGGLLVTRDHQDLGSSLSLLPGPGSAEYFHTHNSDPVTENCHDDDCYTRGVTWPNYHSGQNGDVQEIAVTDPLHPVLRRPDGSAIDKLPAHPHEGSVGVPADEPGRVIATGKSIVTGRKFNLLVAFEGQTAKESAGLGRALADSSFHHFADYNWDTKLGAPSFVNDPEGKSIAEDPTLLTDVKTLVRNSALWLAHEA